LQLGCALLLLVEFALQCQELCTQLSSIFCLFEGAVGLLSAPLVDLVLLEGKSQLSCSPCGDFRSQFCPEHLELCIDYFLASPSHRLEVSLRGCGGRVA
jgi:hypothetical protein